MKLSVKNILRRFGLFIQCKTIQFLKLTCTISFLCMILYKTKWYNNTQIYIFHKNKFHISLQTRSQKIFKSSDVEIWTERMYFANFVSDFVFWFSTSRKTQESSGFSRHCREYRIDDVEPSDQLRRYSTTPFFILFFFPLSFRSFLSWPFPSLLYLRSCFRLLR